MNSATKSPEQDAFDADRIETLRSIARGLEDEGYYQRSGHVFAAANALEAGITPGVPMIALTPERIAALESLAVLHATSARYDDKTLYARNRDTVRAMLAEARGKRAS